MRREAELLCEKLGDLVVVLVGFLFRSLVVMLLVNWLFPWYTITYLHAMGLSVLCTCLFKTRYVKILGDK